MTEPQDVLVATSIAPGSRLDIQREAIQSWHACGLDVVSLNTEEEIAALSPWFPKVRFLAPSRTARDIVGRPLIYISELLNCLRAQGRAICGIVNSDIFIQDRAGLFDFIRERARGALVYGPRVQVAAFGDNLGDLDPLGFDFFFLDVELTGFYGETQFCLGMPFWDHWFPLMPLLSGRPVRKLISPVAKHVPHEFSRSETVLQFNDHFVTIVLDWLAKHPGAGHGFTPAIGGDDYAAMKAAVAKAPDESAHIAALERFARTLDQFTRDVLHFLESRSEKISLG